MRKGFVSIALAIGLAAACGKPRVRQPAHGHPETLAILAVESDRLPALAEAATSALAKAKVPGIAETRVSPVSLEVVQLSIECVEPTVDCYRAVANSLAAQRLLFGQITADDGASITVAVTLFDAETRTPRTIEKEFASEREATDALDALVAEATR